MTTAGSPGAGMVLGGHSPAEIEEGPGGGGDALGRPAEEVELRQSAGLLRLHVLQVEAAHQEILAPDVLRHQVHLPERGSRWVSVPGRGAALGGTGAGGCSLPWATSHTCLVDVVERGAFIWPVAVTLLDTVLSQRAQHDDDGAAVLPHHLRAKHGGVSPLGDSPGRRVAEAL